MTTKISVPAYESPKLAALGWSLVAKRAPQIWTGRDRPRGWLSAVYGAVFHTSGRGLPNRAVERNEDPLKTAVDYYTGSKGCHYIIPYDGAAVQVASENYQAAGVGINYGKRGKNQYLSVISKRWRKDLPAELVERWQTRWPDYANPLDLLPNTKTANSCYVHVEMIPLLPSFDFEPAFEGSLFTKEQHETVKALAEDIAKRNAWPKDWERSPRLLGHEDLTPLPRHDKRGGWDPGWLREKPYFSWELAGLGAEKDPKTRAGGKFTKYR